MFNELTLALHIALIILLYLFLFSVVRVIGRDILMPIKERPEETLNPYVRVTFSDGNLIDYPINLQLLLGRADDCDIILEDTFISSHHASIYRDDSGTWLEDLNSTNGTFLNNKKIVRPVRLTPGDTFKIGSNHFEYLE